MGKLLLNTYKDIIIISNKKNQMYVYADYLITRARIIRFLINTFQISDNALCIKVSVQKHQETPQYADMCIMSQILFKHIHMGAFVHYHDKKICAGRTLIFFWTNFRRSREWDRTCTTWVVFFPKSLSSLFFLNTCK